MKRSWHTPDYSYIARASSDIGAAFLLICSSLYRQKFKMRLRTALKQTTVANTAKYSFRASSEMSIVDQFSMPVEQRHSFYIATGYWRHISKKRFNWLTTGVNFRSRPGSRPACLVVLLSTLAWFSTRVFHGGGANVDTRKELGSNLQQIWFVLHCIVS